MRTYKKVDTEEKEGIMVTEKTIIHGTDKDPRILARACVASALANVDNVDKIVDDLEQYKKKVSQMKETLKKERGEGKRLKRKHEDSLSELDKLREAFQIFQSNKDSLVLSINIIELEKKDLEKQVAEIEEKGDAVNKMVEELESQNNFLKEKLQATKEKQIDITPFRNQASVLQKGIQNILLRIVGEMYRIKQIEARLKELALSS